LQYPCMIEVKGAHFRDPLIEKGDALAQQLRQLSSCPPLR
jgi:hypothetical protein